MFGFDYDEIFNGYSKTDDYIARDVITLHLLIKKGILTNEEIEEEYKKLGQYIEDVRKNRKKDLKKRIEELKEDNK